MVWTGRRSQHGQAVHRGPHQFHVMTVGPVTARPTGMPWASVNRLRLTPPLPNPPKGDLVAPSCSSVPVPPATAPRTPQRQPIPESAGGRWTRSRCPWRPTGSQCAAVEDAIARVRDPGPPAANDGCSHAGGSTVPAPPRFWNAPVVIGLGGSTWRLGVFRHCPSLDATHAFLPGPCNLQSVFRIGSKSRVTATSSGLGVGSPDGWLCATMMDGTFSRIAGRSTSAGRTALLLTVPI